jgi:hypothetical protein
MGSLVISEVSLKKWLTSAEKVDKADRGQCQIGGAGFRASNGKSPI